MQIALSGTFVLSRAAFCDSYSAVSKACYYDIRQLRYIRSYLDFATACAMTTSVVQFKLDYCNSLYYNLPKFQIARPNRIKQIKNSLVRAVVKAPKS